MGLRPPLVPLSAADRYEGQTVCLEATLAQLEETPTGAARMLLSDGNRTLAAMAPFEPDASPGDVVRACGEVHRFLQRLELDVRTPQDLRIAHPWREDAVPLHQLSERPWAFDGRHVATRAHVVRDAGLAYAWDPGTDARLRLALPFGAPNPEPGTHQIEGRLAYDPDASTFALHVERLIPLRTPAP